MIVWSYEEESNVKWCGQLNKFAYIITEAPSPVRSLNIKNWTIHVVEAETISYVLRNFVKLSH